MNKRTYRADFINFLIYNKIIDKNSLQEKNEEGLNYDGKNVKIAKEQWHVSYAFYKSNSTSISTSALGKYIGFKAIIHNFVLNNKTSVKLEMWLDANLNNNWQSI
jgi:hypothetical protein